MINQRICNFLEKVDAFLKKVDTFFTGSLRVILFMCCASWVLISILLLRELITNQDPTRPLGVPGLKKWLNDYLQVATLLVLSLMGAYGAYSRNRKFLIAVSYI